MEKKSNIYNPKITVITSVFNGEKYIESSINSILNQTYKEIEYIIIDGNSQDNTTNILKSYDDRISFWISEPDLGIYDAWNKGLMRASGDWICFVGCDDVLYPKAIEKFIKFLNDHDHKNCYLVSAKLNYISSNGVKKTIIGKPWYWNEFIKENKIAHVGTLHNKKLFEKYGNYDVSYKIVGDYELLLRPRDELNALFLDEIVGEMREGGVSHSYKAIDEAYKARITTGKYSLLQATIGLVIMYLKFSIFRYFK